MTGSDGRALEFPCRFPLKVMGVNEADFARHACTLVARHTGSVDNHDVESRVSRNGRYVALTIQVHAQSQAQLDAIYRSLSASERVLMAL